MKIYSIKIRIGFYQTNMGKDVKFGKQFYSVDCDGKSFGSGSPCNTEQEVIENIQHFIEWVKRDGKEKVTLKNTDFINETELEINFEKILEENGCGVPSVGGLPVALRLVTPLLGTGGLRE